MLLESKIERADIIITGEGELNSQTLHGKVPFYISELARKYNKKVFMITGSLGEEWKEIALKHFDGVMSLAQGPITLEESIARAQELTEDAATRLGQFLSHIKD